MLGSAMGAMPTISGLPLTTDTRKMAEGASGLGPSVAMDSVSDHQSAATGTWSSPPSSQTMVGSDSVCPSQRPTRMPAGPSGTLEGDSWPTHMKLLPFTGTKAAEVVTPPDDQVWRAITPLS